MVYFVLYILLMYYFVNILLFDRYLILVIRYSFFSNLGIFLVSGFNIVV